MEKIVIRGGTPLGGTIKISGMKNAALPILMGCVLVKDECIIENLPEIHDVTVSLQILEAMGAKVRMLDRAQTMGCNNRRRIRPLLFQRLQNRFLRLRIDRR